MSKKWIFEHLEYLRSEGVYRQMKVVEGGGGRMVQVEGREVLVFCSNNYLGLANHPAVVEAVREGVQKWGWGSTGSRLICGNTSAGEELERSLADWLGVESTLVTPSGYAANGAVLTALAGEGDLVLLDKLVHASIIDGAKASGAAVRIWPHRQTDKLVRLLEKGGYRRAFMVTDSLFSMDGDAANLEELAAIKERFGAMLIVDEAHAVGCYGVDGSGLISEQGLKAGAVDVVVMTLSKALGGSGGVIGCTREVKDYLVNTARSFIFTTGIPAVSCLAAQAAVEVIKSEPQRRGRLLENGDYFRCRCRELSLDTGDSSSYIVPIVIGEAERTCDVAAKLFERGYWAAAVRPPTVAKGSSRLRVSLTSEHSRADIDGLCGQLEDLIC